MINIVNIEELRTTIKPYTKEITFNYNNLWDKFLSIIHKTITKDIDPNTILTKQEIIDYLFNLYLIIDIATGKLVDNFTDNGSRNSLIGSNIGFAKKNNNSFLLIEYDPTYQSNIKNKEDILHLFKTYINLTTDPVINKKIIDSLGFIIRENVKIYGSNGYTTYNILPNTDLYIITFWEYLLYLCNFLLGMDFHITLNTIYDDFIFSNISNISIPTESAINAYQPNLFNEIKIGATANDCNLDFINLYQESKNYDIAEINRINCFYNISFYGINGEINTNLLARTFQTTKKELINFISQSYPELWNYFYDSNVGTIFLDILAYISDIINNYMDRNLRESFLLTAQDPNNLRDWALFAGLEIPSSISAITQVKCSLDALSIKGSPLSINDKIVIYPELDILNEKTYSIEKNGLTFFYFTSEDSDNIITVNTSTDTYTFTITLKEGELRKDTFVATGKDFETFTTTSNPVASTNFRVYVNGVEKKLVKTFSILEEMQNNPDGIYTFLADGKLQIIFGNNRIGTQLNPNDIVSIVYIRSNGESGNTLATDVLKENTIPCKIISGNNEYVGEAKIISNTPSGGGMNISLSNKDAYLIALQMQTRDTLITEDDHNTFIRNWVGKNGGKLKGKAILDTADSSANIIKYPLLIPSGQYSYSEFSIIEGTEGKMYPPIITEFLTEVEKRKIKTNRIEVLSGVVQNINFYINLELEQFLSRELIYKRIKKVLQTLFSEIDFNQNIYISDIYFAIETILREVAPKTYLNNACEVSWKYNTETTYTKEPKIVFNYDKLTQTQKNKLIQIFGNETTAKINGKFVSLLGVRENDIVFNIKTLGYIKTKLELIE